MNDSYLDVLDRKSNRIRRLIDRSEMELEIIEEIATEYRGYLIATKANEVKVKFTKVNLDNYNKEIGRSVAEDKPFPTFEAITLETLKKINREESDE